jgi:hypothetical protein
MYIYSFERLEVWKDAKELCVYIYQLTSQFPPEEKFGLVSQMRRARFQLQVTSRKEAAEQARTIRLIFIQLRTQALLSY